MINNDQIIYRKCCPICGSSNIKQFIFEYKKCVSCEGVFIDQIKKLKEIYNDEYYFFDESKKSKNLKRADYQLKYLRRLLRKLNFHFDTLKILDIGCGTGEFVFRCLENGLDAYGVDISTKAINIAITRYKIADRVFRYYRFDDIPSFVDNSYTVITLWEVLEHLEDPVNYLHQVLQLLKEGGILLFSTPNVKSLWSKLLKRKWHGFGIPEYHITYFSPITIKIALERQITIENYEICTVSPYNDYLFLTKNVLGSILPNIKHNLIRKFMKCFFLPVIFPPNKLLEFLASRFLLGDTLIGYAQKS